MKFQYTLALISALTITCNAARADGDATGYGNLKEVEEGADKVASELKDLSKGAQKVSEEAKALLVAKEVVVQGLEDTLQTLEEGLKLARESKKDYEGKAAHFKDIHNGLLNAGKNIIGDFSDRKAKDAMNIQKAGKKIKDKKEKVDKEADKVKLYVQKLGKNNAALKGSS